jgi:hypothetical protein
MTPRQQSNEVGTDATARQRAQDRAADTIPVPRFHALHLPAQSRVRPVDHLHRRGAEPLRQASLLWGHGTASSAVPTPHPAPAPGRESAASTPPQVIHPVLAGGGKVAAHCRERRRAFQLKGRGKGSRPPRRGAVTPACPWAIPNGRRIPPRPSTRSRAGTVSWPNQAGRMHPCRPLCWLCRRGNCWHRNAALSSPLEEGCHG